MQTKTVMTDVFGHHEDPISGTEAIVGRDSARVGDRLTSSAILLWATTMLLRVLQLITTTVLARLLNPSDYGLVAIAMVVVGFLDILSNFQVGSAIIKTKNLTKEHLDTAFTLNLFRAAVTAMAIVVLAKPVGYYMHDSRVENIMYVLAIPALAGGLHNPHFLLFARDLNFRQDSKRDALASILGSVVGIAVAFMFRSYWALVAGSVASTLSWISFSYWRVPGMPRFGLKKSAEMLSYGAWLIFIGALDYINNKMDYLLIGKEFGNNTLGAYHVGQQIIAIGTGDIVAPLSKALLPAFSLLSTDLERLRSGYRQVQSVTIALALPAGLGMSVLASDIILLLVGKKWEGAVPVIAILGPLMALQTLTASIESLALSMGKSKLLFRRTAIFLVVRTTGMFAGFYLGGFIGIIYARVISGTAFLLYSLNLAATITHGNVLDPIKASWRSFVSVIVMWFGLTLIQHLIPSQFSLPEVATFVIAKIIFGGILYIGTHSFLWHVSGKPAGAEEVIIQQVRRIGRNLIIKKVIA